MLEFLTAWLWNIFGVIIGVPGFFIASLFPSLLCIGGSGDMCAAAGHLWSTFFYFVLLSIPNIFLPMAIVWAIFNPTMVMRFLHFIFVRHPADRHVSGVPTLDTAKRPLDVRGLRNDIARTRPEKLRPAWASENLARKSAAAGERLDKEAELLDKAIEREIKRVEYEDRRRGL